MIRSLFEVFPYRFLALDHDSLSIPLTLSVPIIAASLQIFVYLSHGTLCSKGVQQFLNYKLNINPNMDNVLYTNLRPDLIVYVIVVLCEVNIRLYRFFKNSKMNRNRVGPAENIETGVAANENVATVYSPDVGPLTIIFLTLLVNTLVHWYIGEVYYLGSVLWDCVLLILPQYWVVSSQKILDYSKHKMNQMKAQFGYY